MTDIPGRIGDYEIEAELGEGGMATVYRARHAILETKHALKVLHPMYRENADVRQRFLDEAKLQAKQLDHANIVKVSNIVATPEHAALVMELVEGTSLDAKIGVLKGQSAEIKRLMGGILEGVQHAHEAGVIHRDLKPANILLADRKGTLVPKVTDFGIAKVTAGDAAAKTSKKSTHADARMGTLHYMSPEQVKRSKDVTPRSDVYSLGAVLYEMATGVVPFDGENDYDVMENIVNGRYEAPETRVPEIDPVIARVIRKALAKAPAERYASCAEMAAELRGEAGTSVAGDTPPRKPAGANPAPVEMAPPRRGRWPLVAAGVVVAAALTGGGIWFARSGKHVGLTTGEQVIDAAIGDAKIREKMAARRSLKATGTVIDGDGRKLAFTSYLTPDSKRYKLTGPADFVWEEGIHSGVVWQDGAYGPEEVTGTARTAALRDSLLNAELRWHQSYPKAELVGSAMLDGVDTYKVVLTDPEGKLWTWYIGKQSFDLLRVEGSHDGPKGPVQDVDTYLEWRDLDGLRYASKYSSTHSDHPGSTTITDTLEVNAEIPPGTFDVPPFAPPRRAPDPALTYAVPHEDDWFDGPASAKVTIIQISDYACSHCEEMRSTMDALRKKYLDDVRIVHMQYVVHPDGARAAAIAYCAGNRQGMAVDMDKLLWDRGFKEKQFDPDYCWINAKGCPHALVLARQLGLDVPGFQRTMAGSCALHVTSEMASLDAFAIDSVPSYFINGRFFVGARTEQAFGALIDEELAKSSARVADGSAPASFPYQWVLDHGEKRVPALTPPAASLAPAPASGVGAGAGAGSGASAPIAPLP